MAYMVKGHWIMTTYMDMCVPGGPNVTQVREKAFREMKKDVGMTTAQKSKETRRMESLFCISSQQSLHIRRVASDYSAVMYVYVAIVGWIYRTKIDPISSLPLPPYLFE